MAKLDKDLADNFIQLESKYNLPSGLLKAVAYTESRYNSNARSPVGAQGMFQFMPGTAKEYGVDVSDPYSSADGAARYYSKLLKMNGGDLDKALAGYNWGQGNVQKKGMDNMPTETKNYISQIRGFMGKEPIPSNDTEKKSNNVDKFTPEQWAAFDELQAQKNELKAMRDGTAKANPADKFTPEQWAAFDELQAKSQPPQVQPQVDPNVVAQQAQVQPQAMPVVATAPVDPNVVATSPQQAQSFQNEVASQASNMNLQQQPRMSSKDLGLLAVEKMKALGDTGDTNKLADFYMNLKPNQKIFVNEELKRQGALSENTGFFTNIGQGIARSAQSSNQALEELGTGAVGSQEQLKAKQLEIARARSLNELYDNINPSWARTAGSVIGDIAQTVALPGIRLFKGGSAVARGADMAAKGAATSVVTNPSGQTDGSLLEAKGTQAALGGVLSAGVGLGAEKVIGAIAKPATARLSNEAKLAQEAAEKEGIQLLGSELPGVSQNAIKRGQNTVRDDTTSKNISLNNQAQAEKKVKELAENVNTFDKTTYAQKKGIDKVAQDSTHQYNAAARNVQEKINNVDVNNPEALLKVTAEANYLNRKITSSNKYDEVSKLAPAGRELDLPKTNNVLAEAKKYESELVSPELKRQFAPIVKNIEESVGTGKMDYVKADQLFKEMGQLARQATKTGDDNAARFYNDVKKAINSDKDDFVNSLPNDANLVKYKNAYTDAKNYNRENIQSVKSDVALRNIMEPFNKNGNPNLPDNIISNWVKKGQTEKVKTLFNSLDEEGKMAVQQGVLNKLINESTNPATGFIPKKFNEAIKKYNNPASGNTPLDVVFEGPASLRLKELMGVFDNLNTIAYARTNPQTGIANTKVLETIRNIAGLSGAAHSGGLTLIPIAYSVASKAVFNKALTDKKFNRLLLSVRDTNPKAQKYIDKASELIAYITSMNTNAEMTKGEK